MPDSGRIYDTISFINIASRNKDLTETVKGLYVGPIYLKGDVTWLM